MNILITGATGFIGSHTCVALLNEGHNLIAFDNFSNSDEKVLDYIKEITDKDFIFYKADMTDAAAMDTIFSENKIDCVIHFAGFKAVGESTKIPLDYYYNNIYGTICILKAMKAHGVKKIIFSSSATVYGKPASLPIKEDFPLSATNPYGNTKLMLEEILTDLSKSDSEWSVMLLRYFNPVGAHKSGLLCENPKGIPNNLMPRILDVAFGTLPEITVFGDDYDTKDGTGVRDYIHVVDLAYGHVKAIEYVSSHTGTEAVNLGTGAGYSVLDLINTFEKVNSIKIPYVICPRRPGDIDACFADASKAKDLLGWTAELGIEEMCKDAYLAANYIRKQKE